MAQPWQHHPSHAGAFTRYHLDPDGVTRELYQDAEPVVDRAKQLAENKHEDGRFLGSIPVVTYYDWMVEAQQKGVWEPGQSGQLLNRFMAAKLKNPEFRRLTGR